MIHPENIKPGMFLIATSVKGEIREPVLDYTEAAQVQHHHIKFREIAGIPLEVSPFMTPSCWCAIAGLSHPAIIRGTSSTIPSRPL